MRSISGERRWSLVYPALLSLGAGVLASCAAEEPQPRPDLGGSPAAAAPGEPAVHSAAPRPARKPTPPPPPAFRLRRRVGEPTEGAAGPESSSPSSDLAALSTSPGRQGQIPSQAELIGLDQSGAMRLLGPATEKSDEPPATVWRYKTASCELDLFFYLDLRSGSMRTLHYSFKGEGAEVARRQECWRSLIASRGG